MKNITMGLREWLLLILLSLLWGGSFIFNEVALYELQPFTLVLGRVSIAALTLIAILYLGGQRLPNAGSIWGAFFIMGLLNNVLPFSLIVWGQIYIDSGLAAILNSTTPLFSIILAHFFTEIERITPNRLLGVGLGIGGVVVLIGPEMLSGLNATGIGQIAILGAGLSYACAAIYGRRFNALSPMVSAAGMLTGATALMIPLALIIDQPWQGAYGLSTFGAVLGIAWLSTVGAYLIYFRLLATAGPTNLLLVTLLIPANAVVLGSLLLSEQLSTTAFIGMILIMGGLMIIDGRILNRNKTLDD